jgi:hypothetical protein
MNSLDSSPGNPPAAADAAPQDRKVRLPVWPGSLLNLLAIRAMPPDWTMANGPL